MKLVNFYEVYDNKMECEWGGASATEAVNWFRRGVDASILVSVWDEQSEDDFKLVTDKIDITDVVLATILSERERV